MSNFHFKEKLQIEDRYGLTWILLNSVDRRQFVVILCQIYYLAVGFVLSLCVLWSIHIPLTPLWEAFYTTSCKCFLHNGSIKVLLHSHLQNNLLCQCEPGLCGLFWQLRWFLSGMIWKGNIETRQYWWDLDPGLVPFSVVVLTRTKTPLASMVIFLWVMN